MLQGSALGKQQLSGDASGEASWCSAEAEAGRIAHGAPARPSHQRCSQANTLEEVLLLSCETPDILFDLHPAQRAHRGQLAPASGVPASLGLGLEHQEEEQRRWCLFLINRCFCNVVTVLRSTCSPVRCGSSHLSRSAFVSLLPN